MMSKEDRELVDIFMRAQAQPEGRLFSENVLAGIKAVLASRPKGDPLKLAEETISKGMSWIGGFICSGPEQETRKAGMIEECRTTLDVIRCARPEALEKRPVAWLHRRHTTAYVITETVKQLWLKAKPEHVENYTVPLYFGESLAAPSVPSPLARIPQEKP